MMAEDERRIAFTIQRPPAQVDPITRAIRRWRGQHLASAARKLQRAELDWIWTTVNRYDTYDGRTVRLSDLVDRVHK